MIPPRHYSLIVLCLMGYTISSLASPLPPIPESRLGEQIVSVPNLSGTEIAVVDGAISTTNNKSNTVAYMADYNPIIQILSGFDSIWFQGDTIWALNGSNNLTAVNGVAGVEGGATNSTNEALLLSFANEQTRNAPIWWQNFHYVQTLTRPGQTQPDVDRHDSAALVRAYLDDQRDKGYSLTSGLGPWATAYREGANATSPYSTDNNGRVVINGHTLDVIHTTYQEDLYSVEGLSDARTGYGTVTDDNGSATPLANVVTWLTTIADYGASTEASKYHFQSPRPWRMEQGDTVAAFTNLANLISYSCMNADGSTVNAVKYYDRPLMPIVIPMKGLLCAARTIYTNNGDGSFTEGYSGRTDGVSGTDWISGRAKDGAFPSGHTAEAFDRGLGLAYAIPQRFSEMVARAADLGENRIVAAMHSPLDVIGGRIMGTAVTAAALNDSDNQSIAAAAVNTANAYFTEQMGSRYTTLNAYAHCTTNPINPCDADDDYANHDALKKRYRAYLTYGFKRLNHPSQVPQVPKGAEVLLASRLPYLSAMQRRAVLATTEIDSNYPVIDQSRGWGRLNLVDAADGYGAFDGDVELYMDASEGEFSAYDRWRNNISGQGRLHKTGTGTLALEGHNTYSGGTLLEAGTLIAATPTAFGHGTLYQTGGTVEVALRPSEDHTLQLSDYVITDGTLAVVLNSHAQIQSRGTIAVAGNLKLTIPPLTHSAQYTLLSAANGIQGKFSNVTATDTDGTTYQVTLDYAARAVTVTISPTRPH